jgi:integrase
MRSDEVRLLQWSPIDLEKKWIRVGRAKSEARRGRTIPIGPTLAAVLEMHASFCVDKFGPIQPDWYVFPFCSRSKPIDPTRPVTSLRTAWKSICTYASVKFRVHDMRHTTCTKMAEAGVPEATMLAIMGHMSAAMLRRYSHVRQAAKTEAMQAVEARSAFSVAAPKVSPKVDAESAVKVPVTHSKGA